MTRERAKELLPIIQAYADGKEIEVEVGKSFALVECLVIEPDVYMYRIKPEKNYRPFANAEEFTPYRDRWLKYVASGYYVRVDGYCDEGVYLANIFIDYHHCAVDYRFEDGTPCGVGVTE